MKNIILFALKKNFYYFISILIVQKPIPIFCYIKICSNLKGILSIFSNIFLFIGYRVLNLAGILNKLIKKDITVFML